MKNDLLQVKIVSRDTKKVLAIIKELTLDTDFETWMKGKYCGREVMLALHNNYGRKSEGERRKQVAKDDLKRLFYRKKSLSHSIICEKYETNI